MIIHKDMTELRVTGWQAGAKKIAAAESFQKHTDFGLKQAKSFVDECLEGKEVHIQFDSVAPALNLAKELEEFGFICSVNKSDTGELL